MQEPYLHFTKRKDGFYQSDSISVKIPNHIMALSFEVTVVIEKYVIGEELISVGSYDLLSSDEATRELFAKKLGYQGEELDQIVTKMISVEALEKCSTIREMLDYVKSLDEGYQRMSMEK